MRPSLPFPVSSLSLCFFLHLLVALRLRSLRFHSPRLCRVAVFLIQTNVSLHPFADPGSQINQTGPIRFSPVWECIPLQQRLGGRVSANPVLGDISG